MDFSVIGDILNKILYETTNGFTDKDNITQEIIYNIDKEMTEKLQQLMLYKSLSIHPKDYSMRVSCIEPGTNKMSVYFLYKDQPITGTDDFIKILINEK